MQDERIFIDEDEYHGIWGRIPNIPFGEFWVFAMHDGDFSVASREDDYVPPPKSPWLKRHAARIYKLRKTANYTLEQRLLEGNPFPTTILWNITAEVRTPIAYIQSGQYRNDNLAQINANIKQYLRNEVEHLLISRLKPLINNPRDLTPPPLQQLLPIQDFSSLVRGKPEFRNRGLDISVVVSTIQCPEYEKLFRKVVVEPQVAMVDVQVEQIHAVGDLQIEQLGADVRREVREEDEASILQSENARFISPIGQHEASLAFHSLAEKAMEQADPQSVGRALDRMMPNIVRSQQSLAGAGAPSGTASTGGQQIPNAHGANRGTQIDQLYQLAHQEGWLIAPPQASSVREEISIDWQDGRMIDLLVPSAYPQAQVRVKRAMNQGSRIPQTQINAIVQGHIAGSYDLVSLTQELKNMIR